MQTTPFSPRFYGFICLLGKENVDWWYMEDDLDWWAVRFIVLNIQN